MTSPSREFQYVLVEMQEMVKMQENTRILEIIRGQIKWAWRMAKRESPQNEKLVLYLNALHGLSLCTQSSSMPKNIVNELQKKEIQPSVNKNKVPQFVDLSEAEEEESDLRIIDVKSLEPDTAPQNLDHVDIEEEERSVNDDPAMDTTDDTISSKVTGMSDHESTAQLHNTFKKGQLVFAEMKHYPPWPAKVVDRMPGPEEVYLVQFYGKNDVAKIRLQMLYPITSATLEIFGRPTKKTKAFQEALYQLFKVSEVKDMILEINPSVVTELYKYEKPAVKYPKRPRQIKTKNSVDMD